MPIRPEVAREGGGVCSRGKFERIKSLDLGWFDRSAVTKWLRFAHCIPHKNRPLDGYTFFRYTPSLPEISFLVYRHLLGIDFIIVGKIYIENVEKGGGEKELF